VVNRAQKTDSGGGPRERSTKTVGFKGRKTTSKRADVGNKGAERKEKGASEE